MSTSARIAFVDRDGTMIIEPEDQQVDRLDKVELVPGAIPALLRLRDAGYRFVMVSNQDGMWHRQLSLKTNFWIPQNFTLALFCLAGNSSSMRYSSAHTSTSDKCDCRKPLPGLLGDYLPARRRRSREQPGRGRSRYRPELREEY